MTNAHARPQISYDHGVSDKKLIGLNVQVFDATKHRALPLIADARVGLEEISSNLGNYKAPASWTTIATWPTATPR